MTDYRKLAADLQVLAERLTTAALDEKDGSRKQEMIIAARDVGQLSTMCSAWAQEDDLR